MARVLFVLVASAVMAAGADSLGVTPVRMLVLGGIGMLFSLARLSWLRAERMPLPLEYLDFALVFAFIAHTGGEASPLLPGTGVFIIGVTMSHGPAGAILGTLFSLAGIIAMGLMPSAPVISEATVVTAGRASTLLLLGLMLAALAEMERRTRESAKTSAVTDPLTGLLNRRYLTVRMEQEIARRRRYGGNFALLFMDVDGLKRINDRFGHAAGDRFLKHLGRVLIEVVRRGEDLARYGGDEFVLLMPGANLIDAQEAAARISRRLREEPLRERDIEIPIRMSIGVAEYPLHGRSAAEILNTADHLVYRKKMSAKNASSASSAG